MSANSEIFTRYDQRAEEPGHPVNVGGVDRIISAIAGGVLAAYGLRRRSPLGMVMTLGGASLLHRAATGYCDAYEMLGINTANTSETEEPVARDIHVEQSIVIDRSPEELYQFWRRFENLPRFMDHLESVNTISANRSHWKVKGPVGSTLEWDAEIYNEKPNEFIAWRSLEGEVTNAGSVHFEPAGAGGTNVKVVLNYNVPGGKMSSMLASLFGREPGQMIEADLRRLKEVVEAGEVPSLEDPVASLSKNASVDDTSEPGDLNSTSSEQTRAATAR